MLLPVSSAAAAVATTTINNYVSNPLIPSDLSDSCQTYLESLNGNAQLSACTSSLITTISNFAPASAADSFTATTAQVSSALDSLCSQDGCDDALVRTQLGQFYGNCTAELNAGTEVVIGQYDVLYVLVPMTEAICAKDSEGGWCVEDIAAGTFPAASVSSSSALVPANATASASAAGSASSAVADAAPGVTSASDAVVSSAAAVDSQAVVESSAASDSIAASAPVLTAAAIATDVTPSTVASSAVANSSAVAAASNTAVEPTYVTPTISSLVSAKSFSISSYVGAATSPQALFAYASSLSTHAARLIRRAASSVLAARAASDATGVLPVASTWSASNLPFMFLSANMSSTVLCTACTSSIMAPYISWESRVPYPLGLSNSPILGQQHVLWTGLGSTCGSGYLAGITTKAGEQSVSSGVGGRWGKSAAGVVAGVVAVVALLA